MNYEVEIGSTNAIIISIPAGVMFRWPFTIICIICKIEKL